MAKNQIKNGAKNLKNSKIGQELYTPLIILIQFPFSFDQQLLKMNNKILQIRKVSQQELLDEFNCDILAQVSIDESPWRTYLSEITTINQNKRLHLNQLHSRSPLQLKFQKIVIAPTDATQHDEEFEGITHEIEKVKKSILFEQERQSSYESLLFQVKSQKLTFQKEIVDLKSLLFYVDNKEITAVNSEIKMANQHQQVEASLNRGEIFIQKESDLIKKVLTELKDQEREIKTDVSQTLKEYSSLQVTLIKARDNLQSSQSCINKLENELEKKRLAKIDSQMLLFELEAVQMLAVVFLGKGFQSPEQIEKLQNQHFWITTGRYLIIQNISYVSNKVFEFDEDAYNFCYNLLTITNNELVQQQFSLQMFYQRLSKFFNFCDLKVEDIAISLSTIYHYESLFEITLKNQYTDLVYQVQHHKIQLRDLENQTLEFQQNEEINKVYNNFSQIAKAGDEINIISINLLEIHQTLYLRKEKTQRIMWRFLIFFTNGLYRWVSIILTLDKLVTLNKELINKCSNIFKKWNSGENEVFEAAIQKARILRIKKILSENLSQLNNNLGVDSILKKLEDLFFSYLKNDFVFYNWGSLDALNKRMNEKVESFKKLKNSHQAYKDLLLGLPNFMSSIFIELSQEAFVNFQKFLLTFLNRFIDFFRFLIEMPKEKHLTYADQVNQIRRNSLSVENNQEIRVKAPSQDESIAKKGFFGQDVTFKVKVIQKKCKQYERYFTEFKELVPAEVSGEDENLDQNYRDKRQELIKRSDFKAIMQQEERQKREFEKKKEKSYQDKSKRMRVRESEMNSLVGINKRLVEVISLQHKMSKVSSFSGIEKLKKSASNGFFTMRTKGEMRSSGERLQVKQLRTEQSQQSQLVEKTQSSVRAKKIKTVQVIRELPNINRKILIKNLNGKQKSLDEQVIPQYFMPQQVSEILTVRELNGNKKNSYLLGSVSSETFEQFQTRLGNQTFYSSIFSK